MQNKTGLIFTIILLTTLAYSITSNAEDVTDPQFSDYQTKVSTGPFAKKIILSNQQKEFSPNWKKAVQSELNKPVNFAGHYRLYTNFGGQGKECFRDSWVCGWVIDKFSGEIVSNLPKDDDGSDIYAGTGDNGTPVGIPFEIDAYKDSSMVVITGQAIPASKDPHDNPICKSAVFKFDNNKFIKLTESVDGCKIDE